MQFRQARAFAVDNRCPYEVAFVDDDTVELSRVDPQGTVLVASLDLPDGITFRVEPGLPTNRDSTPDGLGAAQAVDFNGETTVFFQPDGSALDPSGDLSNGVVYFSWAGELDSCRAVTLFGATGRIKGWSFNPNEENGRWK